MPLSRVPANGLSLAYREWNRLAGGEPLVLLHGITGSGADWEPVASNLDSRHLIAFDARGHGESDWDPEAAYTADSHFADLVSALDALGIERCSVAGFSMGGGIAMTMAAALPGRIASAIVIDNYPAPTMTPGSRRIAGWISGYADEGAWFDPAIARHFRESLAAGRDERLDLWPMWEAIECPVLLVRGEHSDVLTADLAAEMINRQPLAELVTIAGVSHPVPLVRPRALAAAVDRFVSRRAGAVHR